MIKDRWLELITDCKTGLLSHTKLWTNISFAVVSLLFLIREGLASEPNVELWVLYLATVGGVGLFSKFLSMKYTGGAK